MIDRLNQSLRLVPTWLVYLAGLLWAVWLFYLGLTGGLGVEPINALEREYGSVALKLLVLGLAITPLRTYVGINLIKFRRSVGLTAFFFVIAHLSVWALLDVKSITAIWADIIKRPYITVGMVAFVSLIPLAVTSNNRSIRWLGSTWRQLHKLAYVIAILAAIHFIWLVKGFQIEPIVYLAVILALLALRLPKFLSRFSQR